MGSERFTAGAAVAAALLALAGCALERTTVEQSMVERHPDSELDFLDAVSGETAVSNDDALHGLIMLLDTEVALASYEERVAFARGRGWIRADDAPPGNESATVGLVAVAVCDLLEIQGGVNMWLFGLTQRYCTLELVYREFIPRRTANQSLSGTEFIDLLGRVDDALGS